MSLITTTFLFFSFPAVCINVPFAGLICEAMKSHEHRTQDMSRFTPFQGQYMLLHVPATPTHNKNGSIGTKLRNRIRQLQRAAKLFEKYGLSISALAACAADHPDGGFVAQVLVGHTSHHSLVELKDVSEGDSCWERRLLISHEKMKKGSATELSQPLLFDRWGNSAFSEAKCRP